MRSTPRFYSLSGWLSVVFALLSLSMGLTLAVGGLRLMMLGGSFYHSVAGVALGDAGAFFLAESFAARICRSAESPRQRLI